MIVNKFIKYNESSLNDNIIKQTQKNYRDLMKSIKEYLLLKNKIRFVDYRVTDFSWYDGDGDDLIEFILSDRDGDNTMVSISGDEVNDLLKYVENPELYKNTNKYNL